VLFRGQEYPIHCPHKTGQFPLYRRPATQVNHFLGQFSGGVQVHTARQGLAADLGFDLTLLVGLPGFFNRF
jgi:hypothetical protein